MRERHARVLHRADDIDPFQHFERVSMHHGGSRRVLRAVAGIDHHVAHSRLLQGGGERQSGRTSANDYDIGLRGQHRKSPFANGR